LSDVGKKRGDNEDRFHVSEERQYAILADGMGGRLYGEVASETAVRELGRHIEQDMPFSLRRLDRGEQGVMTVNLLDEWVRDVNRVVYQMGLEDERYREMGTTIVCLLGLAGQVVLAHIGDSRCYRFSRGALSQLTEDHSFVNSQVKQGMLTEEEARESNQRNIITRAIGTADKVKPDIKVHVATVGDRFLMCSDGLTDMVSDEGIAEILGKDVPLAKVARLLVDAANEGGGKDNITVILAEYVD
jgi:protein phosphatase